VIKRLVPTVVGLLVALFATLGTALATSPEEALDTLLAEARAKMPEACDDPQADRLVHILCSGELRVGVRGQYPLFATLVGDERYGYDTDVARFIADRLGVAHEWVYVRAATRISTLAEGGADVVIATFGHNTRRDAQARFIRPHYYRSETIIVGARDREITGWEDVLGERVCMTIGNYANSHLISRDVRVMLFEFASELPQRLADESCPLAAQDDSFFVSYLADPQFGGRFERKFGFDPVPWGMAVAKTGTEDLATALGLIVQMMHRDGDLLALGEKHGIFTEFLKGQHALWQEPQCASASAITDPACVIPPLNATPPPTPVKAQVEATLGWMNDTLGFAPTLPMLTNAPAWELFSAGIVNSVVLVFGALAATVGFALLFGFAAAVPSRLVRAPTWLVVVTLQSSPVVLTLVVAAAVAQAIFSYSAGTAILAAIVALGLMNGCNAGQAIGEAADSLRRANPLGPAFSLALYWKAVRRSMTQILSFLVNAAKGTPIASFIGAPELLSTLTDITSFAPGRVTTYTIVLLFYIGVVFFVVWLCNVVRNRIEPTGALA